MPLKLGILGSTRGTAMLPIYTSIQQNILDAVISVVVSNKADAVILERARALELPVIFIDPFNLSRDAYDNALTSCFLKHQVDLIVLIGYMRILSKTFIDKWQHKIINVHPSLLPAFAGLMDKTVHQAVLDANAAETGCTVHFVTEIIDSGPILIQKKCAVSSQDTADSLKIKVQALEAVALIEAIKQIEKSHR